MRAPAAALTLIGVLAAAMVLAPAAHANHPQNHFTVSVEDLEPGASKTIHAAFENGPLREGWVFMVVGGIVKNDTTLRVDLALANETVATWTWAPSVQMNVNTVSLPETSNNYTITITNTGDQAARYLFYFDQSCDCLLKPLPFPGSYAIFNFDIPAEKRVAFRFDAPEGTAYQYILMQREGAGGSFPEDFKEIAQFPRDEGDDGILRFQTLKADTYYFLVKGLAGEQGAMLEPVIEISDVPGPDDAATNAATGREGANASGSNGTPGAAGTMVMAALATVALLLRRRRL